jgi:hypothetical protein
MKTGRKLRGYFTLLNLLYAISVSSSRQFGMCGRRGQTEANMYFSSVLNGRTVLFFG